VKCDEAKPECLRCLKSGYECDGYVVPQRGKNVLLPKSGDPSSEEQRALIQFPKTGVYIQPSSSPRFDTDIEHQYFMIFQTKTAPELTGYFDTTVWNRKVLQACHDQAYARHAVVALGALWKAQDISQATTNLLPLSVEGNQEGKTLYAFALNEYGRALRLMRDISMQEGSDRLRNTLMSSLLTTCFESYVGNQESALSQAELGVDVLLEWGDECQSLPDDDWTSAKRLQHR
jgi:Fungal Zn(2)-Cys(6) binuclear cluster domain